MRRAAAVTCDRIRPHTTAYDRDRPHLGEEDSMAERLSTMRDGVLLIRLAQEEPPSKLQVGSKEWFRWLNRARRGAFEHRNSKGAGRMRPEAREPERVAYRWFDSAVHAAALAAVELPLLGQRGASSAAAAAVNGDGPPPAHLSTTPSECPCRQVTAAAIEKYMLAMERTSPMHDERERQTCSGELVFEIVEYSVTHVHIPAAAHATAHAAAHRSNGHVQQEAARSPVRLASGELGQSARTLLGAVAQDGSPPGQGWARPLVATDGVGEEAALPYGVTQRSPGATPVITALSPREQEVLGLLAAGASNQEIAHELVITISTVKRHLSNMYAKLVVQSRTQAIARAYALGLLDATHPVGRRPPQLA
jgi:DNA-binding CsgD family transcriptional regulator